MWKTESRQLSSEDLQTLMKVVAEEFALGADEANQLVTKVTSYADSALERQEDEMSSPSNTRSTSYFLGRAFARLLRDARFDELSLFLDRVVPDESLPQPSRRCLMNEAFQRPCGIARKGSDMNDDAILGTLVAAFAREVQPVEGGTLENLAFVDTSFGQSVFQAVVFGSCTFVEVDWRGTVFEECGAKSSAFNGLRLDNRSRVGIAGCFPV